MSHTYKNKTNRTLVIPDVGIIVAGGQIETEKVLESPNLELVGGDTPEQKTTEETE